MAKLLKVLGKAVLVTIAAGVTLIAFLLFLTWLMFGDMPGCGEDSPSVAYARSLSQETLAQLYLDMERYWATEDTPYAVGYTLGIEGQDVPEEFAHLKARKVRPEQMNIMLEGCLDEFVYLKFHGFSKGPDYTEPRQIVLQYHVGAYEVGDEILWREEDDGRNRE